MECFQYCKKKYKQKYQRNSDPIQTSPNSTNSSNTKNFTLDNSAFSSKTSKSTGTSSTPSRSISDLYEERAHNVRVFNLKELRDATRNFSRDLKIGEGGFGSVYKGFLKGINANKEDGILVAVKKLNANSQQGHKQWLAEVQFLGIVDHQNLVKLIGYCSVDAERGAQRLLVYEFINNKTLDHHLFNKSYPSLSWNTRLNIALGAAEGLLYLHEGMEIQVIYRDFKASNILLDEEFKPKLSDFGLAREGPTFDKTHVSTAIMGTNGYAAPDYVETGHLTAKSDVWSFGVVLYELLTGRRSMDRNRPKNEIKLIEWVKNYPIETKKFVFIIDPRLEKQYNVIAAREIARLAESCLAKLARDRPSMSQVVRELKHAIQYGDLNAQVENLEEELGENVEEKSETTVLESSERRTRHLAKLSENAGSVRTRRILLMRERSLFT